MNEVKVTYRKKRNESKLYVENIELGRYMCVCVCAGTYIIHYIFKMYVYYYFTHKYILYIFVCENYKFCIGRYPVNTREKKNQNFKASELDC